MLRSLQLLNFRSYASGLFEFSEGVNIIVGPNASGKTNLLEAIHLLTQGKSFKSEDSDLLMNGADWARINATLTGHERVVKITNLPKFEKVFIIDDIEKKRLTHNSMLPIVFFEPLHMQLLSGEPEKRRIYLDTLIQQLDGEYKHNLAIYKRTLQQRNRLLKEEKISNEHVFVWDVQLCEVAGKIVDTRKKYIDMINKTLTDTYRQVSGNNEELQITYESKITEDDYTSSMMRRLTQEFTLDTARGFTGVGPHRDDFVIFLKNKDARSQASRGETRSCVLALKLIELQFIEEALHEKPLLLLDDVFSELDGKRRRMLAQTLQNYQTFITTTDADVVIEHFSKLSNIIPL